MRLPPDEEPTGVGWTMGRLGDIVERFGGEDPADMGGERAEWAGWDDEEEAMQWWLSLKRILCGQLIRRIGVDEGRATDG
jgi:hypothetical protein